MYFWKHLPIILLLLHQLLFSLLEPNTIEEVTGGWKDLFWLRVCLHDWSLSWQGRQATGVGSVCSHCIYRQWAVRGISELSSFYPLPPFLLSRWLSQGCGDLHSGLFFPHSHLSKISPGQSTEQSITLAICFKGT